MAAPIRPIATAAGMIASIAYWVIFLRSPLTDGDSDLTRGGLVLSTLVYPEGLASTWVSGPAEHLGILDRIPLAALSLAWIALAAAVAWPWLRMLRDPETHNRWSEFIQLACLGTLAGLALLSTVTLLVGCLSALSWAWPIMAASGLLLGASWTAAARCQTWMGDRSSSASSRPSPASAVQAKAAEADRGPFDRALRMATIAITWWLGLVILLGAWVPASEFDVVEYHLQAPKEFFQNGAIEFLPHNVYANMPLGVEMHSLAAMTILQQPDGWLGGLVGKSITAWISLLGAALAGAWIANRWGGYAGWCAAGIWLAAPGIAHVATQGLIDGALATYVLAALVATWQAHGQIAVRVNRPPNACLGWCLAAALLAGAAAAIKYPGLILVTLPFVAWMAWQVAKQVRKGETGLARRWIAVTAVGLLLTCAPWYVKNWVQAGNPVYPLAASAFGGRTLTPEKIEQWQQAHRVPEAASHEAPIATRIWASLRRMMKDLQRIVIASPFVQPAMILGTVLAIIYAWFVRGSQPRSGGDGQQARWLVIASAWIVVVWWVATHRIDRFWLPATGLWAALAGIGVAGLRQQSSWLAHLLVLTGLAYGAIINASPVVTDNRYFVSLAFLRDDVGESEHISRVPKTIGALNQLLDSDSKVLLIGEARVYDLRVPCVYSTCFDINPGEPWLRGRTLQQQRAALEQAGVSHIMINWAEIARYRSPGNYGFSQWPQSEDAQSWVASGLVEPVAWPVASEDAQLFKVR